MFISLDHFEIDEKVFVNISLSTFNFTKVSHGLSAFTGNKPCM